MVLQAEFDLLYISIFLSKDYCNFNYLISSFSHVSHLNISSLSLWFRMRLAFSCLYLALAAMPEPLYFLSSLASVSNTGISSSSETLASGT